MTDERDYQVWKDRKAFANSRGPKYAIWFMDQKHIAYVQAAWLGGYYREMRTFIRDEAIRQLLAGAAQPKVEIPEAKIREWAECARRAASGPVSADLSDVLAALGTTIRDRDDGNPPLPGV